jgi:hypothetical protein
VRPLKTEFHRHLIADDIWQVILDDIDVVFHIMSFRPPPIKRCRSAAWNTSFSRCASITCRSGRF